MRWVKTLVWLMAGVVGLRLSRRSGVTNQEFVAPMPGDDLMTDVSVEWTRATTLDAAPSLVWPWIVQMGFGRGGWYTSRLFDRIVWRLDNPSSKVLIKEFQHVKVGDVIPDGPDYAAYFHVADILPERWIVYRSIRHPYRGHPINPNVPGQIEKVEAHLIDKGVYLDFSWAWELKPLPRDRTRLLVRTRANYSPPWLRLTEIPLGLVDLYHVSTMFRGIARRVHTRETTTTSSR